MAKTSRGNISGVCLKNIHPEIGSDLRRCDIFDVKESDDDGSPRDAFSDDTSKVAIRALLRAEALRCRRNESARRREVRASPSRKFSRTCRISCHC